MLWVFFFFFTIINFKLENYMCAIISLLFLLLKKKRIEDLDWFFYNLECDLKCDYSAFHMWCVVYLEYKRPPYLLLVGPLFVNCITHSQSKLCAAASHNPSLLFDCCIFFWLFLLMLNAQFIGPCCVLYHMPFIIHIPCKHHTTPIR